MKVEQFRIGNLAQDQEGNLLKVVELSLENKVVFSVIDRSKYPLKDGWKAEPKPITTDTIKNWQSAYFLKYVFDLPHKKGWYMNFDTNRSNQIKYVHQLQNLYFALEGKELIIK